jgi:hypothetical protein
MRKVTTMTALADELGITRRRLNQLIAEGKITRPVRGKPFDLVAIKAEYEANTDQQRAAVWRTAKGQGVNDDPDAQPVAKRMAEDRAKEQHFKAELARLEFERKTGLLIPRDEVERTCFEIARIVRGRIQALEPRLQPFLTDTGRAKLSKELRDAIHEFQSALSEKFQMTDGSEDN